jgi:hypothetical protein
LNFDDICDLNNWIPVCRRETASIGCTLDIVTEDSQGCNFAVLALTLFTDDVVEILHFNFELRIGFLLSPLPDEVLGGCDLDPTHPHDRVVDHEPQGIRHI